MSKPVLLIPCRAGSERVPNKNVVPFGGNPDGLVGRKLEQLIGSAGHFDIQLSTNDPAVLAIAAKAALPNLQIDLRPEDLCRSDTPLTSLIHYFGQLLMGRTVIWTHVTSPFLELQDYVEAFETFVGAETSGQADSLVATKVEKNFYYFRGRRLNFGGALGWPRTQDLVGVESVTSGIFICPAQTMLDSGDRLGAHPFFYRLEGLKGVDIDTAVDFESASCLAERILDQKADTNSPME